MMAEPMKIALVGSGKTQAEIGVRRCSEKMYTTFVSPQSDPRLYVLKCCWSYVVRSSYYQRRSSARGSVNKGPHKICSSLGPQGTES